MQQQTSEKQTDILARELIHLVRNRVEDWHSRSLLHVPPVATQLLHRAVYDLALSAEVKKSIATLLQFCEMEAERRAARFCARDIEEALLLLAEFLDEFDPKMGSARTAYSLHTQAGKLLATTWPLDEQGGN